MKLPSGTVTFLFTDIEDSAGLWDRYPGAMTGALARHDQVVKGAIQRHGGYIFATGGDGFSAAFAQPMEAVDAALEAQHSLAGEEWGEVGDLQVRMALHTGIADERDGDYFGPPVNRVGRILSVSHGGDVLISQTTLDLLRHHLQAAGVSTIDLGQRRLKGIGIPERIYGLDLGVERRPGLDGRRMAIAGLAALAAVAVLVVAVLPSAPAPNESVTSSTATTPTTPVSSVTEPIPLPAGTVRWEQSLSSPSSGLVVESGVVYVATTEGTLVAFDLDSGGEKWRFDALGRIDHPPVVSGGVVYVTSRAGYRLYGVVDGEQRLRCSFGFLEPGPPVVFERTIYLGAGGSGTLYTVDSSAGTDCTLAPVEYPLTGLQTITVPPVVAGGYVYLGDARGDVIALRLDDLNKQVWSNRYFTGEGSEVGAYDGRVESLVTMEVTRQGAVGLETEVTVVIADAEDRLHLVDGETGRALAAPIPNTGTPLVSGNRIFYLTLGSLIVLNADLEEVVSINLPEANPTVGPIIDQEIVFYAAASGTVVALDLTTRVPLMSEPNESPIEFLAAADGLAITVDQEGLLSVVGLPTPTP